MSAADPPPLYREWGCGYASLAYFGGLLTLGFLADVAIGGALAHLLGWIVAAVVVLGLDLLVIHATRDNKTLDVTADEIRIGDEAIARTDIVAVAEGLDPAVPVLGWRSGMPRKRPGVLVRTRDDRRVVVPTRRPEQVLRVLDPDASNAHDTSDAESEVEIRPAGLEDVPLLAEIDERADTLFRIAGYDLPAVEMDDGTAAAEVFVAGRPPIAFARLDVVDGLAHLTEIAVLPGSMRRGLGGRLLERACDWAREQGYSAITLTTYADVPWNGPMYARRGWLEVDEPTPGLARIRDAEVANGLDAVGRRIVMRRALA